jgi:hypothetical protein
MISRGHTMLQNLPKYVPTADGGGANGGGSDGGWAGKAGGAGDIK